MAETVTKTCECGATVEVEIPDGLTGAYRRKCIEWQVICSACESRDELERKRRERDEAERLASRVYNARLRACQIPKRLRALEWATANAGEHAAAIDAAQRWASGDLAGLLLLGDVGVGKTCLAATAAWKMLEREGLRWTSVPSLMAGLSADWNNDRRKAALAVIDGADALVLDDLDKSRPSAYAAEQLFGAIDSRVAAGVPLLVTTNLRLDELRDKYPDPFGQTIASRLVEYCEAHGMVGADRRLQKLVAA